MFERSQERMLLLFDHVVDQIALVVDLWKTLAHLSAQHVGQFVDKRLFLAQKSKAMNKDVQNINKEAMELLSRYSWPGNIRELENVIERAVALSNGPEITVNELPEYIGNLLIETYRRENSEIPTLEDQEKNYIKWVLDKSEGNKTKAAKIMGIDRVSLWRKMKRYDMESE